MKINTIGLGQRNYAEVDGKIFCVSKQDWFFFDRQNWRFVKGKERERVVKGFTDFGTSIKEL